MDTMKIARGVYVPPRLPISWSWTLSTDPVDVGTDAIQAATSRHDRIVSASPIVATAAVAVSRGYTCLFPSTAYH
jgi:hypothetical protein